MSEKKSVSGTKRLCPICLESYWDFLEHFDKSDISFILCSNCEAMRTSEDLYGAMMDRGYASPREGVSNHSPYPRTGKVTKKFEENFQETEKELSATKRV